MTRFGPAETLYWDMALHPSPSQGYVPLLPSVARDTARFEHGWLNTAGMLLWGSQRLFSSSNLRSRARGRASTKKPAHTGLPAASEVAQAVQAHVPDAGSAGGPAGSELIELELRAWLAAAARGDRGAAESLLRSLLPRVRNLVRYFVRGDSEVDDLAQESLVTILRALGSYRGEGNVTAWVDRIVARTVFAQLRRSRASMKAHVEYKPELLELPASESSARFLVRRQAMRALDELPEEQRTVLVMHHVMGLSVREIASELDAAFETVRSRLRLGMERLRDAVGHDEQERGAS